MSADIGTRPLLEIAGGHGLRIEGDKLYMRPLANDDVTDAYHRWLNDDEINRFSQRSGRRYSRDDIAAYLADANASPALLQLGMFMREDSLHVGNISLRMTNVPARVAEVGTLIGERDYWGRGVILDAARHLIDFAFKTLRLRKITLGNVAPNRASTFKSRQLGAVLEGRFRKAALVDGEHVDTLEFGLFPEEFYSRFPDLGAR